MTSVNAEVVNKIAADFNAAQQDYKVAPVFKGSYAETMTAAIAAYRAGSPPHIVQVFEVGTATMMAAKGAVKPVYQLMADAGEKFDPNAYLPAIAGYYSTARRQDAVPAVQQLDPDRLLEQGGVPEGRARPRQAAQDVARNLRDPEKAARRGAAVRSDRVVGQLDPDREFQRLAQCRAGDQGERARRPRCGARIQQPDGGPPHRQSGRGAEGQELGLRRAHHRARREIHRRRLRHDAELLGLLRRAEGRRQIRLWHDPVALLPRCRRGAAEHDHRRREPVGDGRQEARGIQGRRQVLHLSVGHRIAAAAARADRLPADHQGGLRGDQGLGLLRQEPGARSADRPADGQAPDAKFAGLAARQSGADPRRHRRGPRSRLRRQERG